jgi:hypothetical protein
VNVRVKIKGVSVRLHAQNSAGNITRKHGMKEFQDTLPSSIKEDTKKFPIVTKEDPKALRDREDEVFMRNVFENHGLHVFSEEESSFSSAGRTDSPFFTGEGHSDRFSAGIALKSSKTEVRDTAVEVGINGVRTYVT